MPEFGRASTDGGIRHALRREPNTITAPPAADTDEMIRPLMAALVREYVRRRGANAPLQGVVDADADVDADEESDGDASGIDDYAVFSL